MFRKHESDVLVAGAGPVGLFAALSLARRGVHTRVFDEAWREAKRAYGLALHPESLRLLRREGVLDQVLAKGRRIESIGYYQGPERRFELNFSEIPSEAYAVVLPQSQLETILADELHKRKNGVLWNHRVEHIQKDDGKMVTEVSRYTKVSGGYAYATSEWEIDATLTEKSQFIIGADGYNSAIRRELEISFPEIAPAETFAVFELETRDPSGTEARVVLDDDATSVLWPLPGNRWRWSFQIADLPDNGELREKRRSLFELESEASEAKKEEELMRLIRERAPWFKEAITAIDSTALVRFEKRLAESFGRDRAWLAGDAAHVTGPLGVRSMNAGLREAHVLAARMTRMLGQEESIDELEAAGRWQHEHWKRMLDLEKPEGVRDPWVQSRWGRIVGSIPASGTDLDPLLAQLRK
jgi:2-polyprenyl-6-methoxyphenol hydroxylase-like FAD-dependent oxidoreductase